jgi:murein tripeptide amidase MpaA
MHGSETISTYACEFFAKFFLKKVANKNGGGASRYHEFLKKYTLLLVPIANPDGVSRGFSKIDMSSNDPERMLISSSE